MDQQQNNTATNVNVGEEFRIQADSHLDFEPITDCRYITSAEFTKIISDGFRKIYADWEGCKIVPVPNMPMMQLQFFFNHRENSGSTLPRACSREGAEAVENKTLAAVRARDHSLTNGDRYRVTKDGMSGLADFLFDGNFLHKRDGKLNWEKIAADVTDQSTGFMQRPVSQQLTCISYIDPDKIAALLFGQNNDGSDQIDWLYHVRIVRSMNAAQYGYPTTSESWLLAIDRISMKQSEKLAAQYGLVFSNGLNITR